MAKSKKYWTVPLRPTKFTIGFKDFEIQYKKHIEYDSADCADLLKFEDNKVLISSFSQDNLTEFHIQSSLWHEIVHAIFFTIGEKQLSCNENLVDNVSNYIVKTLEEVSNYVFSIYGLHFYNCKNDRFNIELLRASSCKREEKFQLFFWKLVFRSCFLKYRKEKLSKNEKFIHNFSTCFVQVLKSIE